MEGFTHFVQYDSNNDYKLDINELIRAVSRATDEVVESEEIKVCTHMDKHADGTHLCKHADRNTHGQTCGQKYTWTNMRTEIHMDKQTHRQTCRRPNRHRYKWRNMHRNK